MRDNGPVRGRSQEAQLIKREFRPNQVIRERSRRAAPPATATCRHGFPVVTYRASRSFERPDGSLGWYQVEVEDDTGCPDQR